MILFVGSSAEDYGSDRMLRHSVRAALEVADVAVLLPAEGPLVDRLRDDGATVVVVPDFALRRRYLSPPRLPGLAARNVRAVREARRRFPRDHVQLVVTNTEAVVAGALLAKAWRVPHVWHVHEILDQPRAFARLMAVIVDGSSVRVLTCSESARSHLVMVRPSIQEKIRVVLNGVDIPTADRPCVRHAEHVVRIACVGRLHPWKGQAALLDGFAEYVAADPLRPTELILFGDAAIGNEHIQLDLEQQARTLHIDGLVSFRGFVAEPSEIYRDIDIVVVPSTSPEPFSLVCAEAQAHGIPVIATDLGGPTEIVVDGVTGLLVRVTDRRAVANALTLLASDAALRTAMGRRGRERAAAHFSVDRYQNDFKDELVPIMKERDASLSFRRHAKRVVERCLLHIPATSTNRWRQSRPLVDRLGGLLRHRPLSDIESFVVTDEGITLVGTDSILVRNIYWYGGSSYEGCEAHWWKHFAKTSSSIVELGANVGFYTVLASAVNPTADIVAVEPHPVAAAAIRANAALNHADHVRVVEAAVVGHRSIGDEATVELHLPDLESGAAPTGAFITGASVDGRRSSATISVPTVSAGAVIAGADLLKLDIEGMEVDVLDSARAEVERARPVIFLEVLRSAADLRALIRDWTLSMNYSVFAIGTESLHLVPRDLVTPDAPLPRYGTRDVILIPHERLADL